MTSGARHAPPGYDKQVWLLVSGAVRAADFPSERLSSQTEERNSISTRSALSMKGDLRSFTEKHYVLVLIS